MFSSRGGVLLRWTAKKNASEPALIRACPPLVPNAFKEAACDGVFFRT